METGPNPPDVPSPAPRGRWRRCWRALRWCGHGTGLFVVVLLYLAIHLNQIGVPDFVKRPLLEQLRERGVELEFSRMRVRLTRGLVIENANLTRARESVGEVIFAGELQLKLGWRDLLSLKAPGIRSVTLRDGHVALPLKAETDAVPFPFRIDNVQGRLRFDGTEAWTLEKLEGTSHGGRFRADGTLANASQLTRHTAIGPKPDEARAGAVAFRRELLRYARALDRMTFSSAPELTLQFHADAGSPEQSTLTASLSAAGAVSADLGTFEQLRLNLGARRATNGPKEAMLATLHVESAAVRTRWGGLKSLQLDLNTEFTLTNARPQQVGLTLATEQISTRWGQLEHLELSTSSRPEPADARGTMATTVNVAAKGIVTEWARLTNATFSAAATHRAEGTLTNWLPDRAEITLNAAGIGTKWAQADHVKLTANGRPRPPESARQLDAWWSQLEPFAGVATLQVTNFSMPKLALDSAGLTFGWSEGILAVRELAARIYGGGVRGEARLDVASRLASAKVASDFDLHRLEPLMTTNAVKWIQQYGWRPEQPAVLTAEGSAVLPVWTNRQPDWRGEVLPTLRLAGTANVTNFTFRGLPGDRGFVPFAHTNLLWSIRNAHAWRPEGEVEFDYEGHTATQDYHFRVRSSVDPKLVRPLLEAAGQRTVDLFQFTRPPHLEGDIWGRWFARERTGFSARLSSTNFTFRGEQVDEFRGAVAFTNQFVDIRNVDLKRGATWAQVPAAGFDAATGRIYLTNAMATLDVAPVTRVIGPKTHALMQAYQFDQPLRAVVNGVIPVRNTDEADVRFEASLGGFHWWRFNTTNVSALVHWQGDHLSVSNLDTVFHGGRLSGNIWVNMENKDDVQFGFDATGKELNLSSLLHDLLPSTNRLEGTLSTHLVVDRASAREDGAWTGRGDARLLDGYLWGLPVFGVLSGPLEAIAPGLGQQKFKEGTATFSITNRVVKSKDLELKSPVVRMRFQGEVGFDAHLDTRMEAELLRDMPVLGGLVSLVLKPFTKLLEFDVRGRLGKPEADFRHVPSFILAPLRPIQTLKALFPDDPVETAPGTVPPLPKPEPEPASPPPLTPAAQ